MTKAKTNGLSGMAAVGLFALVFLSGAAGLLYQVVWQKYLAILLGSHARATALVLAVFLGGLSAGYASFGHWTLTRRWNLVRAYAYIEVALGAWALLFPYFFQAALPLVSSLFHVLGLNNLAVDLLVAIVLVAPPTFLMGGTLPLLTQALSPDVGSASYWHARVYGFNTVGAAFGTLLAGYALVPVLGLRDSLWVGAAFNVIVAGAFYFHYALFFEPGTGRAKKTTRRPKRKESVFAGLVMLSPQQKTFLVAAFLSGFYVLCLETVLIRLVGLATGASNYNFTLIVAVFVFALGVGSLLVRRMESFGLHHLFWNQLAIAVSLWLLYRSGDNWPYWVHVIRSAFRDIPQNFYVYQTGLAIFFGALLVVPIGLCGLTLPLCFHLLKTSRERLGSSVGWLYGLNTVGSVAGALFGGYALLNYFNLDQVFKFAIFLVLASVGVLFPWTLPRRGRLTVRTIASGAVAIGVLFAVWISPLYTKENYIQPFRRPEPVENVTYHGSAAFTEYLARNTAYIHYEDDPNTSVGIGRSEYDGKEFSRTIFVNGKSDGNTRGDLFTTVMLGHIPGILARRQEKTAVIGFGTGITIGVLALYPEIKTIDVMEISSGIIRNAYHFDRYNGNVSSNPKVKFHQMDAFRYLAGATEQYDLIVSEPSNPWVGGVENLYSAEFYQMAKKRLSRDGTFVQWIHTYSFYDELFRTVLATMSDHFKNVSVFQLKGGDFALVGTDYDFTRDDLRRANQRFEGIAPVGNTLSAYGVKRLEALLALEIIPPTLTRKIGEGVERHTLENPRLSHGAARAFFDNSAVRAYDLRRGNQYYFATVDETLLSVYLGGKAPDASLVASLRETFCDNGTSKVTQLCSETLAFDRFLKGDAASNGDPDMLPRRDIAHIDRFRDLGKREFQTSDLKRTYEMFDVLKKYYSPIARIPAGRLKDRLDRCAGSKKAERMARGECLLQKVLLLQMFQDTGEEFYDTVDAYYQWFADLKPNDNDYEKFRQARQILDKLIATPNP